MAEHQTFSDGGLCVVNRQLREARERHLQRLAVYKAAGYDRAAEVGIVVDRATDFLGPVLDVGSGQGMLAMEFARRGFDLVSVDVSWEEQVTAIINAEAERLGDRIAFRTADASRLPFPDESFGAAATMDALHHLTDGGPVFAEMVRVVKKQGRILVAEFDERGLEIVGRVHQAEGRHHPVGPVTFASAIEWFLSAGLTLDLRAQGHFHSVVVFTKP